MTAPTARPAALLPSGGAWLRVLLVTATIGMCFAAWIPTDMVAQRVLQIGLMTLATLLVMAQPGSALVLFVLAAVLADRIFFGSAVLDGQLVALAVLVPLVHQLAALAAAVPLRSTLRISALLPTAMRYVGATLITLIVLIVAGLSVAPFGG